MHCRVRKKHRTAHEKKYVKGKKKQYKNRLQVVAQMNKFVQNYRNLMALKLTQSSSPDFKTTTIINKIKKYINIVVVSLFPFVCFFFFIFNFHSHFFYD